MIIMSNYTASQRQREIATLLILTALCGVSIFFYFLFIGGTWFLAFVGMIAVLLLVGVLNYLIWGKHFQDESSIDAQLVEPEESRWSEDEDSYTFRESLFARNDDTSPAHRFSDLPPAIRRRMQGSLPFPGNDKDSPKSPNWWE
jgi:hypothetical protein